MVADDAQHANNQTPPQEAHDPPVEPQDDPPDDADAPTPSDAAARAETPETGPVIDEALLNGAVEAILLASDRPLGASRIARALGLITPEDAARSEAAPERIRTTIDELNAVYAETGRSFRIEEVAGGYRIMTQPEFAPAVGGLLGLRDSQKLTRAALETLSIIAYRQPITRAQLEAIRGVGCGEVVRSLLEKRMISITGRAEEPGRPMLYGTSRRFLEVFGLASLKDLPAVADIMPPAAQPEPDEPEADSDQTPEVSVRAAQTEDAHAN